MISLHAKGDGYVQKEMHFMKGYLPTLDGWRALAILGVMLHHITVSYFYPHGPYPSEGGLYISRLLGDKGVDIFFAISGFLICSRLLQEHHKHGEISLRGFYIRRFFRILPPYIFYLAALAWIASAGFIVIDQYEWVGCLLFIRNYFIDPKAVGTMWYTGHCWSLSVEEHFYLFWPLVLVLCGLRRARPVVVLLALVIALWRGLDEYFHLIDVSHITRRTDTCLDGLLWGCWAALLLDMPRFKEWATRRLTMPVWLALSAAWLFVICYEPPFNALLEAFLTPWLLVGTVLHPSTVAGSFLEWRPMRWLGRLSYSLYLWQQLFLLGSIHAARPFDLGLLQELPFNLMAVFAMAMTSYYLVERPMIALGQRLAAGYLVTPIRSSEPAVVMAVTQC
jgi:peptidoglycan/LPS O-acetylase OafA/YrhL